MTTSITLPKEYLCLSAPQEPDVKMWVSLGGKVLPVFTKDTEERANVFGEIAGIEGKEYKVHLYDGRDKIARPYEFCLFLDGKRIYRDWLLKDDPLFQSAKDSAKRQTVWSSRKDEQGQRRALVFSSIATTDDKSKATKSTKTLENVGTIAVKIRRIKDVHDVRITKSEQQKRSAAKAAPSKPVKENLIDEELKKASTLLAASAYGPILPAPKSSCTTAIPTKETVYKVSDDKTPYLSLTLRVRSPVALEDEMFGDTESDHPVASTSGSSKRNSAALEDNDEEDDEDIEAQLKALEEKRARLLAKKAKTEDIKPKVSPPPPFDWQGRPPIDMGQRIYVDFEEKAAGEEEKKEVERERLTKERIEKGRIEL
ncbi:hypothetical protein JCM5353_006638 [Sporobolomyces roseus]